MKKSHRKRAKKGLLTKDFFKNFLFLISECQKQQNNEIIFLGNFKLFLNDRFRPKADIGNLGYSPSLGMRDSTIWK